MGPNRARNKRNSRVISGLHRGVNENFILLGCYAALIGKQSKKNLRLVDP
jgi:hypothetical protein